MLKKLVVPIGRESGPEQWRQRNLNETILTLRVKSPYYTLERFLLSPKSLRTEHH